MIEPYLDLKNVCKSFPDFQLENISLSLPKGYIMGLVGPNGSGKTTTIRLILNVFAKDSGQISVFGKDNVANERHIKQEIGVVFDTIFYMSGWKIKDTEKAISGFYKNWNHGVFKDMTERFELPWDKKIRTMSRGMQMKLMLACAFSHDAKLLILDEPTSGLDPVIRDEFLEILQEYVSDGERSVLFSTHITSDLERVADYITFLSQGKVFYTGSTDALLNGYHMVKGKPRDLTPELETQLVGLRKTDMSFEGLIETGKAHQYKNNLLEAVSINDVVVCISRGGKR